MLLLGIDLGTSSVKVSVVDAHTQACLASTQFPETESDIISLKQNWAEQSPNTWWNDVVQAIKKLHSLKVYNPNHIQAIGIAYQMHGLVCIDKQGQVLRNSIIWCDSRAVEIGEQAFKAIGREKCLSRVLNSPGNFTASKLAWVKHNEPNLFEAVHKIMLPGDFIAMMLTNELTTTASALSEGIFWDFKTDDISEDLLQYFGFDKSIFPEQKKVFDVHGQLSATVANLLSLPAGIPISYKAGDQPNNAFALNVLKPNEVAANAGTSGVLYGIASDVKYDDEGRINSFAHVNHTPLQKRLGTLLCINGAGIYNKWIKQIAGDGLTYDNVNSLASTIAAGCEGLVALPFGNGAERMFNNQVVGSHLLQVNFNIHNKAHIFRAVQEGLAFAFKYGMDVMQAVHINPVKIKAGYTNLFLSEVFTETFVNTIGIPLEMYNTEGSIGAALGAGLGANLFKSETEAFQHQKPIKIIEPSKQQLYTPLFQQWKQTLLKQLNN